MARLRQFPTQLSYHQRGKPFGHRVRRRKKVTPIEVVFGIDFGSSNTCVGSDWTKDTFAKTPFTLSRFRDVECLDQWPDGDGEVIVPTVASYENGTYRLGHQVKDQQDYHTSSPRSHVVWLFKTIVHESEITQEKVSELFEQAQYLGKSVEDFIKDFLEAIIGYATQESNSLQRSIPDGQKLSECKVTYVFGVPSAWRSHENGYYSKILKSIGLNNVVLASEPEAAALAVLSNDEILRLKVCPTFQY
jgi:molecular chaperone DnaK (HSP70)